MTKRVPRLFIGPLAAALSTVLGASSHATTPVFAPTGSMQIARAGHQATLLLDGRVLVSGGYDNSGAAVAAAEIFSPVTGTWSVTARNAVARMDHRSEERRVGKEC